MESSEKCGVSIFLNKEVILWILESDLQRPKAKYGELVSIDHTHVIIQFTQGPLKGQKKAYLRNTIQRIDLNTRSGGDNH
ncbi:MAG: hypothetical protein WBG58_06735 [Ignavibacteriaceae bacterium]